MSPPFSAGARLTANDWEAVRRRAIFECCKWDIQSEDHCVLADFPILLEMEAWEFLSRRSEQLAREAMLAEPELLGRAELLSRLGLPRKIRRVLGASNREHRPPGVSRVMRFDFHFTAEGWRISEANVDVPGGFIEASRFTELMAEHYCGYSPLPNPCHAYRDAVAKVASPSGLVAFVHATAHSDDRQVMEYLARDFKSGGLQAVMISPEHLQWESGIARIASSFAAGTPAVLVRFFPAEWLCALRPDSLWIPWFLGGKTAMSNPGSALLLQSKRFPLTWGELDSPLATWRELLPETRCPSELRDLSGEDWVLKPIFGRVGEDVAISGVTDSRAIGTVFRAARKRPEQWIAQRRFEALPIETAEGPRYACIGVFTIDGCAAGAYGRIASKALIDQEAQDVAILVRK